MITYTDKISITFANFFYRILQSRYGCQLDKSVKKIFLEKFANLVIVHRVDNKGGIIAIKSKFKIIFLIYANSLHYLGNVVTLIMISSFSKNSSTSSRLYFMLASTTLK